MDNTFRKVISLLTVILGALTLLFEIVGFSVPGWFIAKDADGNSVSLAVWYTVTCTELHTSDGSTSKCLTFSHHYVFKQLGKEMGDQHLVNKIEGSYNKIIEWEVEMTISVLFCLVGGCMSGCFLRRLKDDRQQEEVDDTRKGLLVALLLLLISGILSIVAVAKIAKDVSTAREMERLQIGIPHALIVAGLGGACAMICSFSLFLIFIKHKPFIEDFGESNTSTPMMPFHYVRQGQSLEGYGESGPSTPMTPMRSSFAGYAVPQNKNIYSPSGYVAVSNYEPNDQDQDEFGQNTML